MRLRRVAFFLSFVSVAYATVAGCGDDDAATTTDTPDGSTPDSATPDTSVDQSSGDTSTNDGRSPEYTGSACTTASECYADLDAALLDGPAYCIDKVTNGYCTHECQDDNGCCAVPGECKTSLAQVCASFENTNKKLCFLSCEPEDIAAATDAGLNDAGLSGDDYCKQYASPDFGCRSTGGGAANRKVCFPTGTPNDGGTDAPADAPDAG